MNDINSLFDKCMTKSTHPELTARNVSLCMTSPFTFHCDLFAPEKEKEAFTEYEKLLFKRGNKHEEETVEELFPNVTPIKYATMEDGFRMTLESMIQGAGSFHEMPLYYLPDGLYGKPDILEKSTDAKSIFGDYYYQISEIKLAKRIQDEHIIQGAFYNYVMGQIQGYTPKVFMIINRDNEIHSFEYSEYESDLWRMIEYAREIHGGLDVSPTFDNTLAPWSSYGDKKTIENRDVSLISGISFKTKKRFADLNYNTIDDVANANISDLVKIDRVGKKTATQYKESAQAIIKGTHKIRDLDKIDFPNNKVEIFLDLEGIDPINADEYVPQIDYLIGILVRDDSSEKYTPFIAKNTNHEKEMLLEFLEYMKGQDDFVIYHYHHYERTHLKKMMETHEIDLETQNMIFDNMIDIYKVATDSIVFPTYGNGLKLLAKYMGFKWRHKDVSATESIAIYLEYADNPQKHESEFQKVIDYNEDDCVATRVVKDWLANIKQSLI